jgi:hypothetical protein
LAICISFEKVRDHVDPSLVVDLADNNPVLLFTLFVILDDGTIQRSVDIVKEVVILGRSLILISVKAVKIPSYGRRSSDGTVKVAFRDEQLLHHNLQLHLTKFRI